MNHTQLCTSTVPCWRQVAAAGGNHRRARTAGTFGASTPVLHEQGRAPIYLVYGAEICGGREVRGVTKGRDSEHGCHITLQFGTSHRQHMIIPLAFESLKAYRIDQGTSPGLDPSAPRRHLLPRRARVPLVPRGYGAVRGTRGSGGGGRKARARDLREGACVGAPPEFRQRLLACTFGHEVFQQGHTTDVWTFTVCLPVVAGICRRPVVAGICRRPVVAGICRRPVVAGICRRPVVGGEKRQRTRTGRGPDAGRTTEFKETDADRTRTGRGRGRFSQKG
eukprot:gene23625-biopygen16367